MSFLKDKKIISLLIVLSFFTIIYFISVNKISYAFDSSKYSKESYNSLIDTIKKCSKQYAINNNDIFNEENVAYIKVQDLIDSGFIIPNSGENIVSPLDNKTIMNSIVIKIKKDNNNINYEIEI